MKDIDDASRSLGAALVHCADLADGVTDEQRADALASAFVDLGERCFPGGFANGQPLHVDLIRGETDVRVWAVPDGCKPRDPTAPPVADLARAAFEAYGASTGGKTWDGKPIPPFDVIRERTPHVAAAWEAAADAVRKLVKP